MKSRRIVKWLFWNLRSMRLRKHLWFQPGEGIVQKDVEGTIKSMGYIGRVGMKDTDKQILNIMIDQVKVD